MTDIYEAAKRVLKIAESDSYGADAVVAVIEELLELSPILARHVLAQPAPATDVDALLAEAEDWARLTRKLTSDVEQGCAHVLRLATALRESRAREVAEPYRHALEQRLICSNLPLLTGDADADLMRFVFHEQEIALSPEAGVIAELKEQRDTALSWTATYTNMDVYRRCLAAAIARAEKAEAERKDANRLVGDYMAQIQFAKDDIARLRHQVDSLMDELTRVKSPAFIMATEGRIEELEADLAAARAELGALAKKAAEAVEVAYKSGITDTSSMPGPKIIEQMWQDSTARRAALAIRVVKEAQ